MSEEEVSVQFHVKGFDKKVWRNPSKTSCRVYLYKTEDNMKIECGYFDVDKHFYCPPDKRRKHADHNVVLCEEGDATDGLVELATVDFNGKTTTIHYKTDEKMESKEPVKGLVRRGEKEEVPEPVVDEVVVEIDEETGTETLALNHIAKITKSAMKVSISYGNTVEVKSRSRGLIQSQYPKFSLSVDFEGGNIMERLEEAADAVVQMVEDKLTEIVADIT